MATLFPYPWTATSPCGWTETDYATFGAQNSFFLANRLEPGLRPERSGATLLTNHFFQNGRVVPLPVDGNPSGGWTEMDYVMFRAQNKSFLATQNALFHHHVDVSNCVKQEPRRIPDWFLPCSLSRAESVCVLHICWVQSRETVSVSSLST